MTQLNKPYNNTENMNFDDEKNILQVASGLKPCTLIENNANLGIARDHGLVLRQAVDFRGMTPYYDYIIINDKQDEWYKFFKHYYNNPATYASLPRQFESFYDHSYIKDIAGYFGRIEPKLEERIKGLYTFVKNLIVAEAGVFLHMFPRMDFELPHDNDGNIERLEVIVLDGLLFGYDINETEHSTEELVKHQLGLPNRFADLE